MEKKAAKIAIMLLAFSVGVTAASIFYFQPVSSADGPPPISDEGQPPMSTNKQAALEMVFVLDTTGSMGGLLEGAKQKIWSIVNEVQQKQSRPSVKVGLVAYRDCGDAYVTQITPLTEDLDKVYSNLMDFEAAGGGDGPEDVRRALSEGVGKAGWSKPRTALAQIVFLVGDAPPHDYENEPDVLASAKQAVNNQIVVNTIQCGGQSDTKLVWQQIAQYGQGKYFAIAQDGGVQTIDTPYDAKLAELGRTIGGTYMAYGAAPLRQENADVAAATESKFSTASNSAMADRTLNKAMNKDAYRGDLIQDIENGKTRLSDLKQESLPEYLQRLPSSEREKVVAERITERKKVREEILNLSKQRDAYIATERKKSGKTGGFDDAVAAALSEQLQRKGIR